MSEQTGQQSGSEDIPEEELEFEPNCLSHRIRLFLNPQQLEYCKRACGTARFTWNMALDAWNKKRAAGEKTTAMQLKKEFNDDKYARHPWLKDIHRDAHAQPFTFLGKAVNCYFKAIEDGKEAHWPKFKKKGHCRDSFYVANDRFRLDEKTITLPKIGDVDMAEELRFKGKILSATVSRTADKWFVSIQVEIPDEQYYLQRKSSGIIGVDLGVKDHAVLSTGEKIQGPKPLKAMLRRLKIRQRRVSRKYKASKEKANLEAKEKAQLEPKEKAQSQTKESLSQHKWLINSVNYNKSALILAKTYAHIANIRADFIHKLTVRLCRENQVVVIENLNVLGMLANHKLAQAISDMGFGMFRVQMQYKAKRYGTQLVMADRWYPSSRLCSVCGWKNEALTLKDRQWTCAQCGSHHDRDINAALNLKRLATATALPMASASGDGGAAPVKGVDGKVTPVRDECDSTSGQEKSGAHLRAHS